LKPKKERKKELLLLLLLSFQLNPQPPKNSFRIRIRVELENQKTFSSSKFDPFVVAVSLLIQLNPQEWQNLAHHQKQTLHAQKTPGFFFPLKGCARFFWYKICKDSG